MSDKKPPLHSFAVGNLSVCLWENEVRDSDRTYKTVAVEKSYYDKDKQEYEKQSVNVNPSEIGCLVSLLQRMESAVVLERNG